MKAKLLYSVWGCFYILCVGLGFIPNAEGFVRVLLILVGVLFFVPGVILLYDGMRTGNRRRILQIRWISIASLSLTLLALVASFLTVNSSAAVGNAMYEILVLVSAPMICCQYWVLSMFLWACLLMATFHKGETPAK